jgi:ABC-type uncharacterized transport system substrate-binding protein
MRRRDFIAGLGSAAAWPAVARGQQGVRRLGWLSSEDEGDALVQERLGVFRRTLQELGWVEGVNLQIEYRWANNRADSFGTLAQELVAVRPDVILANAPTVPALQQATRTIPIVFMGGADPVAEGFVASLVRPGGNVTGYSANAPSIATKRLQLLKEVAPDIGRVAFIFDPWWSGSAGFLAELEAVAPSLGIRMSATAVHEASDIEQAIGALVREGKGGLLPYSAGSVDRHRELIIALANQYKVPTVFGFRRFVTLGGLMSYGTDASDLNRRAASYIDRILRGAKPSDLPAQQPVKFEFVLNRRTATALDLTIPATLLALADEVIE